jgi:zinc D-Ala-D-Ala dipeptidase
MLCRAARSLPKQYKLGIIEGWRGPHIQRRMYMMVWKMMHEANPDWSETKLRRVANQFTAPLSKVVPPPHSTGGAVDVNLLGPNGEPLDHSSPYKYEDPKGFFFDAPGLTEEARRHRHILAEALSSTGLTNYPSEYWHWSYGDQGWAYRGGHPNALYGPVQPPNWEPAPEDVSDEPLYLLRLRLPER